MRLRLGSAVCAALAISMFCFGTAEAYATSVAFLNEKEEVVEDGSSLAADPSSLKMSWPGEWSWSCEGPEVANTTLTTNDMQPAVLEGLVGHSTCNSPFYPIWGDTQKGSIDLKSTAVQFFANGTANLEIEYDFVYPYWSEKKSCHVGPYSPPVSYWSGTPARLHFGGLASSKNCGITETGLEGDIFFRTEEGSEPMQIVTH